MLILILIDAQYSQKAVYRFEKDSNRQNNSSGSLHAVKIPLSSVKFTIPLTPYRYLENPYNWYVSLPVLHGKACFCM